MKKSLDNSASGVNSTNEKLWQLVEYFYKLHPTKKEQEEICGVLLGKLENHFKDFFENCVVVERGEAFGWPWRIFNVKMPKSNRGSKWLDFNGFVSANCPNHPVYWDDKTSDIYKTIYTITEIEELIREIRQCKRELWFYVDEDCSDLFKSLEAKNLAGIIKKVFWDKKWNQVDSLWVKDENWDITYIYLWDNWFSVGYWTGEPSCLFAHSSDVKNDDKIE